jgi:ribosomal protein L9
MSKPNEGDGKFVVVENGQRVSDLHDSQDQALKEAENRKKKLSETSSDKPADVSVKQNLFGSVIVLLVPVVKLCATTCTSW